MTSNPRHYGAALLLSLLTAGSALAQAGETRQRGVSATAREGAASVMAASDSEGRAVAREAAGEALGDAREAMQAENAAERPENAGGAGSQGTPEERAAREAARAASVPADETPEARETRREAARAERWQAVQARTRVGRPEELPEPARAELRVHARREARLRVIRQRAVAANDTETVTRADAALDREARRHDAALTAAAAQARGDEQPNENAAEGQVRAAEGGEGAEAREEGAE